MCFQGKADTRNGVGLSTVQGRVQPGGRGSGSNWMSWNRAAQERGVKGHSWECSSHGEEDRANDSVCLMEALTERVVGSEHGR